MQIYEMFGPKTVKKRNLEGKNSLIAKKKSLENKTV